MRVSLAWLSEFIPLPADDELTHRLEVGGFEDVAIETTGPDLGAVIVGRVVKREPHPNADRLSLCSVDLGGDEPIDIVCGAPNVADGQKVAVALSGTTLPDGTKLKRTKIRGVVSNGMICSRRELDLGEDHEGILVLDADARVGAPLRSAMATGEKIIDVGITPNRGDTASLIGLAREVRAHFGGELTIPPVEPSESGAPASDAIAIRIEAPDGCHRYAGRIVRGVTVGPSPDWVVAKLEASGIRPINNVVDITNLVLLEFGQPLHGFDLAKIAGGEIRVRRAVQGEKLAALDGETRELDPADLVIADAQKAVALAGVMGGSETEIGAATRDVLIESAHFAPMTVRLSARRHAIHSEASYRFERGVDREGVERAAARAARLIAELAGGEVAAGDVVTTGDAPPITSEVRLEAARANRLLGTSLDVDEMRTLLARLGIEADEEPVGCLRAQIPSHRNDLHVHQDLTEEIVRIYGYDQIPATLPTAQLLPVELPTGIALSNHARDALVGAGLQEVVTLPFLTGDEIDGLRLPADDPLRRVVRVANPIHDGESIVRSTLLPSLLKVIRQNRNRQVERVRVFEVSRVFQANAAGELPRESLSVSAALVRPDETELWENPTPLFFEARGMAERLLFQMGYVASFQREGIPPYLHPGAAAALMAGGEQGKAQAGKQVGAVGELHPDVLRQYEIDAPCALIELSISALESVARRQIEVSEISRQPRVRRDVAVVLGLEQPAGEVLDAIRKTAGQDLVSADLFDRYAGKGVPEGRVSLAFRLVFQRADRTLKDSEVTKAMDRVLRMIAHRFGGELR